MGRPLGCGGDQTGGDHPDGCIQGGFVEAEGGKEIGQAQGLHRLVHHMFCAHRTDVLVVHRVHVDPLVVGSG